MKGLLPLALFAGTVLKVTHPMCGGEPTNVLPGVKFRWPARELRGRIMFVHSVQRPPYMRITTNLATLYEVDLRSHRLRALGNAPIGDLVTSADGRGRCVVFVDVPVPTKKAFLDWDGLQPPVVVELGKAPVETVLVSNRTYFCVDASNGTHIVWFDAGRQIGCALTLTGASRWQYQDYDQLVADANRPEALCFHYKPYGKRLEPGEDFGAGWYRYDLNSWQIRRATEVDAQAGASDRTADGRCLFFVEDAGMKPARTLAVGARDDVLAEEREAKSKSFRVLTRFPVLGGRAINTLVQMSPCRQFALVRHGVCVVEGKAGIPGWLNTYYVVDVATGKAFVLLRDLVITNTGGFMSNVCWVSE